MSFSWFKTYEIRETMHPYDEQDLLFARLIKFRVFRHPMHSFPRCHLLCYWRLYVFNSRLLCKQCQVISQQHILQWISCHFICCDSYQDCFLTIFKYRNIQISHFCSLFACFFVVESLRVHGKSKGTFRRHVLRPQGCYNAVVF